MANTVAGVNIERVELEDRGPHHHWYASSLNGHPLKAFRVEISNVCVIVKP
jgi:hypothetical protein